MKEDLPVITEKEANALRWIEGATALLDDRFRIPGTNIRFGLDFLIGLVPYVGDVISFGISGLLVMVMARTGASGRVVLKMLGNIFLDTVVGLIPLLGDLFDLTFRANRRNLNLLKEHYAEDRHEGSAWPVIIGILLALFLMLAVLLYGVWKLLYWIFS